MWHEPAQPKLDDPFRSHGLNYTCGPVSFTAVTAPTKQSHHSNLGQERAKVIPAKWIVGQSCRQAPLSQCAENTPRVYRPGMQLSLWLITSQLHIQTGFGIVVAAKNHHVKQESKLHLNVLQAWTLAHQQGVVCAELSLNGRARMKSSIPSLSNFDIAHDID